MVRKIALPIKGMTCTACAKKMEKFLGKVAGVKEAIVNFTTERATLVMDESVPLSALLRAVRDQGYDLHVKRIELRITDMQCAACAQTIEKALKKTEGVLETVVNFAAENVFVTYIPTVVDTEELVKVVNNVGYTAKPPVVGPEEEDIRRVEEAWNRLRYSLVPGLIMMILMMLHYMTPLDIPLYVPITLVLGFPIVFI